MSRENRFKEQNIKLPGANRNLSAHKTKEIYIQNILQIMMIHDHWK